MGDDVPIPMTPHSTSPSCLPLPPTPSKVVDEQQGSKDAAVVSCLTFDRFTQSVTTEKIQLSIWWQQLDGRCP